MRKIYFLFIGFLPFFGFSQPSTAKIDSLQRLVKKGHNERNFQRILNLAELYSDSDLKTAQKFAKEAITIAEKEKNTEHLALALNTLGNILQYKSELDSSLIFTKKSLELRIKNNDSLGIADSYNNIGIVYDQKADYSEALKNYFKALEIYDKKKDEKKQAMTASNIGVVYKAQKDYRKSLKYYFMAYEIYGKQKNDFGLAVTSGNIGSTLIPFKKYEDALKYSKISEEGYKKLGYDRFRGYPVANMAVVFDSLKNYKLASKKYLEAIKLHEQFENGTEVADNSKNYSEFLLRQKSYDKSVEFAHKAIRFAEKADANLIENQAQHILAKNYAALGKYDLAYEYQQKHIEGREKIFQTEKTKSIIELETKYQTAKKDNEIILQKSKLFKRNVTVFSLSGLLIIVAIASLALFRSRQKNEKIKLQREILHQQDLATKAVMNAEDNERKRMATHLHDGIGQLLSAANMNVEVLDEVRENDESYSKILGKTKEILDEAIADVRSLSHQIMPNMLIKNSLSNALRELIEKSTSPKLNINLKMEGLDDAIDQNIQVVLYRTIQECINNTIKHAEASHINIEIIQDMQKISTEISDNGKGFDPLRVHSKSDGLGLENIRSRIDFLKGNLNIKSSQNEGTSVYVEIPLI